MAAPYAGTKMGTDGKRYADDDPSRPTSNPAVVDRTLTKVQPVSASVSLAADDEHVVPFNAAEVKLNLNDANDAPSVTFANPGHRRYAEFFLLLINADDSTNARIDVPNYVKASPTIPAVYIVGNSPVRLKLDDPDGDEVVTADFAGNANSATVQGVIDDAFGEDQFVVTASSNQLVIAPVEGGDYEFLDNEWTFERDEVQALAVDATTVTVTILGVSSGSLTVSSTSGAEIVTALQANDGVGNTLAGLVGSGADGGPYSFKFGGDTLGDTNHAQLTAVGVGGAASATPSTTQQGHAGVTIDAVVAPASTKTDFYKVTVIGGAGDEPASVVMNRVVAAV